ncbi:MAG: efflux RND transporter periplasmic adaptor subunit [Proteobacteria bacterium]|nr:efflux RND transporter periplasmic adaptor subunit [Pseudomonadota bacterium]MBU1641652.1 efflux RND transporter periplasmic adaptor subunit [Pseudomonadota bacterium]
MQSRSFRLILICFLLLLSPACDREKESKEQRALPIVEVRVASVSQQLQAQKNEVTGTVSAVDRATIAARVAGVINELPIDLGSVVQKGDVLAKIGADEITARLRQAEARLEQARRNVDREKRLLEKEAATRSGVKDLEEALRIAEAGYQEARTMFGYTTVTAPFAGLVAQKMVNIGDLASPGTPLLTLESSRRLQIVVEVPETLAQQIEQNAELPFMVPAADFSGTGRVAEIAPVADPLSRTATVKIAIEAQPRLRPGQFARVTLAGSAVTALLVPTSALVSFGQMEQVFIVEENVARLRLVRSGGRNNGMVEIISGLHGGEQVVTANNAQLIDGQPLKVMP